MKIMDVVNILIPKLYPVEILGPDKIVWHKDKAKALSIGGMYTELGMEQKLLVLNKKKQLIPRFKTQFVKGMFGMKERYQLYTPDWISYYPLEQEFDNEKFGIKPGDYNQEFLKNMMKTHMVTRFNKEEWWKLYLPIIGIGILIVFTAVYVKSTLTVQADLLGSWERMLENVQSFQAGSGGGGIIPELPPQ